MVRFLKNEDSPKSGLKDRKITNRYIIEKTIIYRRVTILRNSLKKQTLTVRKEKHMFRIIGVEPVDLSVW